jgi:phosphate acetyltransferase
LPDTLFRHRSTGASELCYFISGDFCVSDAYATSIAPRNCDAPAKPIRKFGTPPHCEAGPRQDLPATPLALGVGVSALDDVIAAARAAPQRVVLAEGDDPRIVEGAVRASHEGVARTTLIGRSAQIHDLLRAHGADPDSFPIIDPTDTSLRGGFAAEYHVLRRHKGVDMQAARDAVLDPLVFAALMVRLGHADGTIAGAVATTADTVRAALQIIGGAPGNAMVSSFFLMMLDEFHHPKQGALVFADCGLVVEPDAGELAGIAVASARSFADLTGSVPKVAMLTFSTHGSARHERVTKVIEATALARAAWPDLLIDGDLQFDSAFVPAINAAKAPGSPIAGDANVFVFPSLEAANIGYKIAQRIGGAKAIGPILQGLAHPANDLSRGCSAEDVYHLIAVTSAQAAARARQG